MLIKPLFYNTPDTYFIYPSCNHCQGKNMRKLKTLLLGLFFLPYFIKTAMSIPERQISIVFVEPGYPIFLTGILSIFKFFNIDRGTFRGNNKLFLCRALQDSEKSRQRHAM
jgi:hypothetical protein